MDRGRRPKHGAQGAAVPGEWPRTGRGNRRPTAKAERVRAQCAAPGGTSRGAGPWHDTCERTHCTRRRRCLGPVAPDRQVGPDPGPFRPLVLVGCAEGRVSCDRYDCTGEKGRRTLCYLWQFAAPRLQRVRTRARIVRGSTVAPGFHGRPHRSIRQLPPSDAQRLCQFRDCWGPRRGQDASGALPGEDALTPRPVRVRERCGMWTQRLRRPVRRTDRTEDQSLLALQPREDHLPRRGIRFDILVRALQCHDGPNTGLVQ